EGVVMQKTQDGRGVVLGDAAAGLAPHSRDVHRPVVVVADPARKRPRERVALRASLREDGVIGSHVGGHRRRVEAIGSHARRAAAGSTARGASAGGAAGGTGGLGKAATAPVAPGAFGGCVSAGDGGIAGGNVLCGLSSAGSPRARDLPEWDFTGEPARSSPVP